jgi:hypothetical protein
LAIQTERPGGGDDRIPVFRARSADEARKARAALEAAAIPVDLPDQAIDAIYGANPTAELAVKVALKHSAKAIQAIAVAIPPPPEPASEIAAADDRSAAAAATLAPVEAPKEAAKTDQLPASAVDKEARRAAIMALMGTVFPPVGFVAAIIGVQVLGEMSSRPNDSFYEKPKAKLAIALGLMIGFFGSATYGILLLKKFH